MFAMVSYTVAKWPYINMFNIVTENNGDSSFDSNRT